MTREEITYSNDYKASKAAFDWWYSLPEEQRKAADIDAEPDLLDAYEEGFLKALEMIGWHDAQGDNLPEYGREVIVLERRNHGGYRVCFGHRPNPKEYVVIDGKKCFAKTHDKGQWSLPDLAYWLDVELPEGVE